MNDQMKQAWDAGLACLRPTPAQLDHGLELHRASLVFDAYGFSPTSTADAAALRTIIDAGASPLEHRDFVESQMMLRHLDHAALRKEYELAWTTAGVTAVFQNAGEETQQPIQCLKRLARFTHATDRLQPFVRRAALPDDVEQAHRDAAHCLYFSSNAVPLVQQWHTVEEDLTLLKTWFELGCRMMHLTYNRRNMLGDGCMESANAGLSDFGRTAIAEMNRIGIIVDVAHSGWQSSLEAAKASTAPMVISHSVCTAVNEHRRGKPDDVIRAVVDTGGYIGICAIPAFLGNTGDLTALLDHLDYAIRAFGSKHVAIGTDRGHRAPDPDAAEDKPLPPQRPTFQHFWPPDDPYLDPHWRKPHMIQSTAWTNWPLITVGLAQRGHSDDAIRDVIGANVLRVARAVLNHATT